VSLDLDEARRKAMLGRIQSFFAQELDEEIGELKARLVLHFFLETLGAATYNQGAADVQAWLHDKLLDLEGELFEDEER